MNSTSEALADGLAENGYAITDDFLSLKEVQNILNLKEFQAGLEHFKKAGVGKNQNHQINEAIRGDYISWIDKNSSPDPLKIYLDRIKDLTQFLNESLFLSLKDYEIHMTMYPPGTYYKRHLDQFNRDDHRKLSVICYLNEVWDTTDGGQLRMYLPEHPVEIFPIAGRLVCFRSDQIEHEVLPATRTRLSLTGWILDQYASLKHL